MTESEEDNFVWRVCVFTAKERISFASVSDAVFHTISHQLGSLA